MFLRQSRCNLRSESVLLTETWRTRLLTRPVMQSAIEVAASCAGSAMCKASLHGIPTRIRFSRTVFVLKVAEQTSYTLGHPPPTIMS